MAICAGSSAAPGLIPTDLRSEYLRNPLGLDVMRPRLSWVLTQADAKDRGQRQTAYQVLVASGRKKLVPGKADLWDSGKVESDQSVHVVYAGKPLRSRMACYWKVRVWDKDGRPSAWSKPAMWTMGLLGPEDWRAKWIAYEANLAGQGTAVTGADWIWFPEGDPKKEAPPGTRYFRKLIRLGSAPKIRSAKLVVTADNSCIVFINGQEAAKTSDWRAIGEFDVTKLLGSGENVIAIAAANEEGAAGLVGKLTVEFGSGQPLVAATDRSWKASNAGAEGWTGTGFDESEWASALELGEAGCEPWGTLGEAITQKTPSPIFRKTFEASKPVNRAYAYICGLGYYELRLNGRKVGDRVLDPGFTHYDKRAPYAAYDVTDFVKPGRNAVGIMLGNGWYNMHARCIWDSAKAPWRNTPRLIFQMHIEYKDGSSDVVVSDGAWKATTGPIAFDCIRNGEKYDARLEKPGWDTADYSDARWRRARVVEGPAGKLVAQMTPPIRVAKVVSPVKITESKPGVFIFDMGQNLAGWGRLTVSGPAGTTVRIRYSERLRDDGLLDERNAALVYSGEFETDAYTLKGKGVEVWEPRFIYHGFRYALIEGFPGRPTADNLKACVVHTDFEQAGAFECSNELLNRIQRNTLWSYLSNFVSIPTDCPHREKNGWTGDAQIAVETGLYNFGSAANYSKWMYDFDDAQRENGELPGIVPTPGTNYGQGPAWDSAYILIPWSLYLFCGDTRVLEQHYEGFKRLLGYMTSRADGHIVSYGLGDWCPPEDSKRNTPEALTSTAYYYIDALTVSKAARVLGRQDDARRYGELAEAIKKAFNDKFLDKSRGAYAGEGQTSMAAAIYQGLVPSEQKDKVMAALLAEVERCQGHLDCGILGAKYVMHVLADNGKADVAYTIATQRTYPSWGWCIEQGATTIWEWWTGDNSQNHIMFGDVSAWFYDALAGINPDPECPGFKRIIIRPHPVGDLEWVRAEHVSMYGPIRSRWARRGGRFELTVEIPANTTAAVYVPAASGGGVTEGGSPADRARGVRFVRIEDGCAVYEVGSGRYQFASGR